MQYVIRIFKYCSEKTLVSIVTYFCDGSLGAWYRKPLIHRFHLSGSWNCCRNCLGEEEDQIRGARSKIFFCFSRVRSDRVCGVEKLVTSWMNWVAEYVRWVNDSLSRYRRATLPVLIVFHQPPLNVTVVTIRPNWFDHIVQCYNKSRNKVVGVIK